MQTRPLTVGSLDVDVGTYTYLGVVHLAGERGFFYDSQTDDLGFWRTGTDEPLPPGETISLHGAGASGDIVGTLQFEGVTYPDLASVNAPGSYYLVVDARVPLPPVLSAHASITAPFTVEFGFFWHSPDGSTSLAETFLGSGLATFDLAEIGGWGVPSWHITHMRGEISSAPIPEPSTLFLMGSAGAFAAIRTRRRRRTKIRNAD